MLCISRRICGERLTSAVPLRYKGTDLCLIKARQRNANEIELAVCKGSKKCEQN